MNAALASKSQHSPIDSWNQAIKQVSQIILGKETQIRWMFAAFLSGGHVLLEDAPGMGKTTLARAMASTLGLDSRRIQFTSDLMPADVVGLGLPMTSEGQTRLVFHPGPLFAHIVLADEINRASPRTQSALLEAMAESAATVDGIRHSLPNPFWVIATQNPVDMSGTFPLPDSQMDRFALRFSIGYPSSDEEVSMLLSGGSRDVRYLEPILAPEQVIEARREVRDIKVSKALADYVQRLGAATRSMDRVAFGLSPRALLSILSTARALAWLDGREFVVPEDIKEIFIVACAHRISSPGMDWDDRAQALSELLLRTSVSGS